MKKLLPWALALLCLGAHAAPPADTCLLTTAAIAMGTYLAGQATTLDASGSIVLDCNRKKANVVITVGSGISGNSNARAMGSGANRLGYQLYQDAARTVAWTTRNVITDRIAQRVDTYPVYARIFANQDVTPGAYSDALTVTVLP